MSVEIKVLGFMSRVVDEYPHVSYKRLRELAVECKLVTPLPRPGSLQELLGKTVESISVGPGEVVVTLHCTDGTALSFVEGS